MSFQISPELDAKKVFLVRSSELEGRLDPNFYSIISKPAYNFICIKKIAKVKGGKRIPKGKSFSLSDTKFRYMRVEDIANNKLVVTSLKCISKELFEFLERYEVKENDLVISIAGTVGRTIIVNNDTDNRMILTENAAKIVLLSNKLTVDALNIILQTDLVQNQIKALYIQTTIPKLGLDKILNLKIPIPSIEVQSAIVAKMDAAYSSKREKEAEAQRLLASIDAYLLGELGIELPEQEENTVQSRIFIRRFSEISGGRFDPVFFRPHYGNIINSIRNNAYSKLGNIVNFSNESWNQKDFFSETFPYIEIGEIDLVFGEVNKINHIDINEAPSRAKMIVRGEDIIISTTRPSRGAIAIIDAAEKIFIASTGFAVIRKIVIPSVFRPYLFHILRSSMSLQQMEQRSSGGNYPAITQEELAKVLIPLPSLEKQAEISDHITLIRSRAKQLQQEAKEGLEQAKRAVEAMLLGDSSETL